MPRNEISFDFNEDEDPVVEINRYREALSRQFTTMQSLADYLSSTPTAEEWLAQHATQVSALQDAESSASTL